MIRKHPSLSPLAFSLFLSGAAALAYQVIWVRQLTLLLGTNLVAISVVLGSFMAGLGIGSLLAARWIDALPGPRLPRVYGALEIGIGLFAALFPLLTAALAPLSPWIPAVLLLVPTTLMGATLPTLVALRERSLEAGGDGDAGRSAAILYAANTGGAVAGSLGAALVLVPWAGMRLTTIGSAGANALAAAVVLWSFRAEGELEPGRAAAPSATPLFRAALAIAALSGFAALVSEVAWTRSLVLLIGPTAYGYAFIVSAVIFGLAVGGAAGGRFPGRGGLRSLGFAQLGAGLASLALIQILGRLVLPAGHLVHRYGENMPALLGIELASVAALLFLPSFFFGATFPVAVSALARGSAEPGWATGTALAWNTAGALLGSLAAAFWLIPALGSELTLYAAAGVHLLACAGAFAPRRPAIPALAAAAALALPFLLPRWDRELLSGGLYKYATYLEPGRFLDFLRQGELLLHREDHVATVSVKKVGTRLSLAIDGKVDATSSEDMLTQRMLAHVPLLLHGDPKSVLVIGLGSGVTAGSALIHPIERLEVVEISEAVAEASALFTGVNHDPASDPRFRLVIGDGRNHLLRSRERWDVIVSEPSNPWMAGVSSLFTRDFFEVAKERLADRGLFCQWAHIYNLRRDELETIVASFTDAFESSAIFLLSESDALLVGSKETLPRLTEAELESRMSRSGVMGDLEDVGIRSAYAVRALFTASTPPLSTWAAEADRHTDDRPILELRAARAIHEETSRENRKALESIGEGEVVFDFPSEPTAQDLLERAEMLERVESFDWAREHFAAAVELEPDRFAACHGLVRTAMLSGRAEWAEKTLIGLPGIEPVLALVHLYRGLGRLDDAVRATERALAMDSADREALKLAAEVASDRGEIAAMSAFAERMLALDPSDAEAETILAEAALLEGRFDLAARRSAAVLARSPELPRALQVHGVAHAELGNENLARESLEKLVALAPENWMALANLARLELTAGNVERAASRFEEAVDLNPRNLAAYQGLEEAAKRTGDRARLQRARSMVSFLEREQSKSLDP